MFFAYDQSFISPTERKKVEVLGDFLLKEEHLRLVIEGHCDERGSDEYNLDLSRRRASSVVQFLIDQGVDAGRLTAHGYGERIPVDVGHNARAWAKNRRVEFVVLKRADE